MDSNLTKPSTQATALMVSPSVEHQKKDLVHTIGTDEMLSAGLQGHSKTNNDAFLSGTKADDYSYVIFAVLDSTSGESLGLMEDMYKYYGSAPVTSWVISS